MHVYILVYLMCSYISSSVLFFSHLCFFFLFKQKTAYEMRISDWSSDVCSSDLKPVRGFKSIPTAYATIKGFEVMRALRKGQARPWCLQPGIRGEVRLVERAFGIGPSALTEAMGMLNHHFAAAA